MKGKFPLVGVAAIAILSGCTGMLDSSRIKNEPFEIDNVYRRPPIESPRQVSHRNGSIWQGDRAGNTYFSDQRATRIGDIITVKIVEESKASEKATTDTGRNAEIEAGIAKFLGLETKYLANKYITDPSKLIAATSKNSYGGSGETKREGAITATMSAKVVEVMPNGNLAVEGRREVSVNNERKEILLQGIVRPKDIAYDNSVYSTQVADAKVILTGVGVVAENQSPGFIMRLFNKFWPF